MHATQRIMQQASVHIHITYIDIYIYISPFLCVKKYIYIRFDHSPLLFDYSVVATISEWMD
jgi:hypothetical protein